ncbi:MAG TPA: sulfatase, partial [Candidatus Polarisedimenticolia bacterium]|nr:sulfatase [Candidatus Polarisedimenticolia bacterium]
RVLLSLSLTAAEPGIIGFWGAPAVRSHHPSSPAASSDGPPKNPPRGVIVIWADTLRKDHLSVYGHERPTSPVLDRMAAEGALFTDCVAQATWTKVATPSLMTSLYPATHGVTDFSDRLPAAATTMAEVYRDAGYATFSLSSIPFTGKFTNLHQGFEVVHESSSLPDQRSSKTAREYVDRLLPWLETHRDVPFFVFLHVSDPHDPFKPYPPYDALWADPSKAAEHEHQLEQVRKVIEAPLLKMFGMPTRAELVRAGLDADEYVSRDRDWYDGSIRAMDTEIGRVIERLRTLGIEKDTLVVFTGDHGEEFLEHGRTFHGQSVYGELTNVPLILWGPGRVQAGTKVDQTVQTIDLMPTLLDLSGLDSPSGIQGHSLTGLLAGGKTEARAACSQKAQTFEVGGGPPPNETESFAVVLDGWKLVHHTKRLSGDRTPEFELFDTRSDPLNATDKAAEHPEIVGKLAPRLRQWLDTARAARLPSDADAAQGLSDEEMERLRSLGYIQ